MRKDELEQNANLLRQAFQHALEGDGESAVKDVRAYVQGEKSYALAHVCFESLQAQDTVKSAAGT